ncbi:hypothetical protein QVM41_18275 [Pseudomonas shirazica]|uniref:hypothetical protein n=1 Tax=Pseudomonas shirazica TaxID=1940636 RepID=UPI003523A410
MNDEPFDLEDLAEQLSEISDNLMYFLNPLAETMQELEQTLSLDKDIRIIRMWYSNEERLKITQQIDAAWIVELDAHDRVGHVINRGDDPRTMEEYAKEHGEIVAQKAFTPHVMSLWDNAKREMDSLRAEHPLIFRVHSHVKGHDFRT